VFGVGRIIYLVVLHNQRRKTVYCLQKLGHKPKSAQAPANNRVEVVDIQIKKLTGIGNLYSNKKNKMKKNKKVRLYVNGERQKDVYLYKTKFQVFKIKAKRFFKKLFILTMIVLAIIAIFKIGGVMNSKEVVTQIEVKIEPQTPVLDRIAKCESPTGHYKNGQVAFYGNKNGSVDIGKFMINNAIWGKKATEMGLNLTNEKDNETFAKYLYQNYGTEPWIWSKHCWNK